MRAVGWITTILLGVAAAVGLAIGARSVPDVRRYIRIRAM
jgi:hypothetical protein